VKVRRRKSDFLLKKIKKHTQYPGWPGRRRVTGFLISYFFAVSMPVFRGMAKISQQMDGG
jgi:hypothetical protein